MSKVRAYIRIAKDPKPSQRGKQYKFEISDKAVTIPLSKGETYNRKFLPTISFAIDFDVPDELFEAATKVIGEISLTTENTAIEGSVLLPYLKDAVAKAGVAQLKR